MNFGKHVPTETRQRGTQSPMAAFSRGTQAPGTQWRFAFPNGFGASVINDGYGAESGRYELAVLDKDGRLSYETPITDDVLGFLTAEEVSAALDSIAGLSPAAVEAETERRADDKRKARIAELREELAALEAGVSA